VAIANPNNEPITVTPEPAPAASLIHDSTHIILRGTTGGKHQAIAAALIRNAVHQRLAADDREAVRWFCQHPEAPEDLLVELCDRGVCLDELGHRQGPRKLLEKMADEHRYPEAILSLAICLFEDSGEPAERFAEFLNRHIKNEWLLETLARRGTASSAEKEAAFRMAIAGHPREKEFMDLREIGAFARRAAETRDAAEMERLFAADDPQVWRALASNRAAPRELLEKLASVEGVKNAREIRNLARERLKGR